MKKIDKAITYAKSLGFAVIPDRDESQVVWRVGYPHNKPHFIGLAKRKDSTKQLYDLLHELGHHEIRKDWRAYKASYPMTAEMERQVYTKGKSYPHTRRISYRLEEVREEFQAWDMGLKIARELGIRVDISRYRDYAAKNLMTYVRYHGGS